MSSRIIFVLLLTLFVIAFVEGYEYNEIMREPTRIKSLGSFFSDLKRASARSLSSLSSLLVSIPFTKIIMSGAALLSLFFIFVRLIVVLGPILLLGAMARENTDASDLLKLLIDFYNQIIIALDESPSEPNRAMSI